MHIRKRVTHKDFCETRKQLRESRIVRLFARVAPRIFQDKTLPFFQGRDFRARLFELRTEEVHAYLRCKLHKRFRNRTNALSFPSEVSRDNNLCAIVCEIFYGRKCALKAKNVCNASIDRDW